MKKQILSISLVTFLFASGLALYIYASDTLNKNSQLKRSASSQKVDTHGPFSVDPRQIGKEVASLAEAEAQVGRKIKMPDANLTGDGEPMIRIVDDEQQIRLIWPNDLMVQSSPLITPPGIDAREFFARLVEGENEQLAATETAALPNRPADLSKKYQLLQIAGNPGYGNEKNYQLIDGKKYHPLPASVIWAQDGVRYSVHGAPEMSLSEVIKIAESVAKSN